MSNDLITNINILRGIKDKSSLRNFFIEELNFKYKDSEILGKLKGKVKENVQELSIISEFNDFNIVLCVLNQLRKGEEREVFRQVSDRFYENIIIFTTPDNKEWHFVNKKPFDEKKAGESLIKIRPFRRIVVGADERLRTAAERLFMIEVKEGDSAFAIQRKCDEAFDVEEVSRNFYNDFVIIYKAFRKDIKRKNNINENLADKTTQKIFNRLIFLYYLQKKGYLENDRFYFKQKYNKFKDSNSKNYYRDFLIPLFQKLSRKDFTHPEFESIPFLNGGLFDFEDEENQIQIPNNLFENLFDKLLEKYNFTIRENTDFEQEVAIDPEMLGTIFEQLILKLEGAKFKDIPDARKGSGSYYTPKFIVSFMVKQSILNYLERENPDISKQVLKHLVFVLKLDAGSLSNSPVAEGFSLPLTALDPSSLSNIVNTKYFVRNCRGGLLTPIQKLKIKKDLKKIRVVDPAVGSGAFVVGYLLKMFEIIEALDSDLNPEEVNRPGYCYNTKLNIIQHNIYGVDIQERAVGLSNLRLWLSLIVDLKVDNPQDVPALPNLDFHIFCGNSLISHIGSVSLESQKRMQADSRILDLLEKYKSLKDEYTITEKKADRENMKKEIDRVKIDILRAIKEYEIKLESKKIIDPKGTIPEQKLKQMREKLKSDNKKLEKLNNADLKSIGFNWGIDFFDIIADGGFNVVIGNPPYGIKEKEEVRDEFHLGNKDSYGIFTVLGIEILKIGGTLCFIMSDTWQTIRTHKSLRDMLLERTYIQSMIFVPSGTFKAMVNVGVYSFVKKERESVGAVSLPRQVGAVSLPRQVGAVSLPRQVGAVSLPRQVGAVSLPRQKLSTGSGMSPDIPISKHPSGWSGDQPLPHLNENINWLFAADFSPLSIKEGEVEAAFDLFADLTPPDENEKIESFTHPCIIDGKLYGYTVDSNREWAIFGYRQDLIKLFSNHSFFIASPKLFLLMQDVGNCLKSEFSGDGHYKGDKIQKETPVYTVSFNGKRLKLVKLGDVADVVVGLQTGDNYYYLRQSKERIPGASRNYKVVDYDLVLKEEELERISSDDELRKRIIEKGISKEFRNERYFGGRYFVPYDKGGASDIKEGWLPNYYVPTDYYIDWSEEAVVRMKTFTISERINLYNERKKILPHYYKTTAAVIRNPLYYFKRGITFSSRGANSPTFRIKVKSPFDKESSSLFFKNKKEEEYLGILASKFFKFIIRNYIQHTVSIDVDALKLAVLIESYDENRIKRSVNKIIERQKQKPHYDYMTNEQLEIDKLVYEMYNLNNKDIKEVKNWFFRRYPTLAENIEKKIKEKALSINENS